MDYKVLIPTSGIGSRLGDITKYTNKSLVKIGKRPAISYIIEKYPVKTEFVITLGYFGNHVEEFLRMSYPERNFTFVNVDKFEGPGSSLGYSILQAKDELQCPFIYNACDTINFEKVVEPDENWVMGYKTNDLSQYDSYNITADKKVSVMFDKGEFSSDFAYIGLIGVFDYNSFWNELDSLYNSDENNSKLSDFWCVKSLIDKEELFSHIESKNWYDIGNVKALQQARKEFPDKFPILDKSNESIYLFDDFVIKFFSDEKIARNRVERSKYLKGLTPNVLEYGKHFYKYEYVEGDLYSDVALPNDFSNFLDWCKQNLWKNTDYDINDFRNLCFDFYIKKTNSRIKDFLKEKKDERITINGISIPPINEIISLIDTNWLCDSNPTNFHGDLILDNIIKTTDGYCLLDWRQDFGGKINVGDMYYDLAKLNHNLTVNHDIINSDLFSISKKNGEIIVDINRKQTLVECQSLFHNWIVESGYDLKKVKILTSIIWLNMSPLHHKPFDEFLFYFGKYNLYKELKNI